MGFLAENEDLVPEEDKFYFGNATVKGLREQLRENGMITSGRKYELYLRLQVNGLRLYTDDRPDDIEDEDDEVSESDEEESDSDEEESEPDEGEQESDSDEGEEDSESESDEEEAGSPNDEDSEEGGDQPGNNQGGNDQGGDPPGGGSNNKRRRNDDDDDDDQNQERSQSPPPRKTRRLGSIPAEIQLQILQDLNFAQLWNLIVAFPEGYLGETINVFLLDAYRQHAIDYPDAYNDDAADRDGADGGDSDGGSSSSGDSDDSEESDGNVRPDDDPDRPLSLLQYVENRVIYDSAFRATQGTYINQLVDTYLQVYGQDHPAVRNENVIEDILWYFRPRPADDSLIHAASRHRPGIVHLLLLRGADVNQQALQPPTTPLYHAATNLQFVPEGIDGFLTVFALIGAGADVTMVSQASRDEAGSTLGYLNGISLNTLRTWTGPWRRVINLQGLSVREFIADERSDYYQRMIPAMYALFHGNLDYPNFV